MGSSIILSIIFVLGSVAALWLALSVSAVLALGALFIWNPRYCAPLWLDVAFSIALMPCLVWSYVWALLGFSGKEAQRRVLNGLEFP